LASSSCILAWPSLDICGPVLMLRVTNHYVVSYTSHCHCMVSIIRHSGITGDCRSYVNIHDSTCPLRNGALSIGIYKLMLRIGILIGVCLRLYMHHQGDQDMNRHRPQSRQTSANPQPVGGIRCLDASSMIDIRTNETSSRLLRPVGYCSGTCAQALCTARPARLGQPSS
jgi:hypothetical protein